MSETTQDSRIGTVFISYSREDLDFADQLDAALRLHRYGIEIDRHGISGGEDWKERLGALIRHADTVVFVLSQASARSAICKWEVSEAVRLGKRIIPVVCRSLQDASPPPELASLNYIFFYAEARLPGSGFGTGLASLVSALGADLPWLREHTRLLQRATEWEAAGRPESRLLFGESIAEAKSWAANRPKDAPEPTVLHLDLIRASEQAEAGRQNVKRQQLEEMAEAQAARAKALAERELAQAREAAQARRVVKRTLLGGAAALVLAVVAGAAFFVAEEQRAKADHERLAAVANESRALTALSSLALAEGNSLDALKLAIAAWPRASDDVARPMLGATLDALSSAVLAPEITVVLPNIVALSQDGSRALEYSSAAQFQIRDTSTGRAIGNPQSYPGLNEAIFSPDNKRLATRSGDNKVSLWDATSGAVLGRGALDQAGVQRVVFTGDSTRLVMRSADGTVRLWDTANANPVGPPLPPSIEWNLQSANSKRLAILTKEQTVQLWDVASGAAIGGPLKHPGVQGMVSSADGKSLATVDAKGTVQLWDTATAAATGSLAAASVRAIGFLGDGRRLFTQSTDGKVRLWDTEKGRPIGEPLAHEDVIVIEVSRDGSRLATRSKDGTVGLWDASTGARIGGKLEHEWISHSAFSPDSRRLVTWSGLDNGTIQVWDARTGEPVGKRLNNVTNVFRFTRDGRRLGTVGGNHTVQIWDTLSAAPVGMPIRNAGWSLTFSADGKRLTTWQERGTMKWWDITNGAAAGEPVRHLGVGDWRFSIVAPSPDGKRLVTVSGDGSAMLSSVEGDAAIGKTLDQAKVRVARISDDSKLVATVSEDGTARLWSAADGAPVGEPLRGVGFRLRFSPDGQRLAVQLQDGSLRLWDVTTGKTAGLRPDLFALETFVFAPDGKLLATGSNDGMLRLWNGSTGAPVGVPLVHAGLKLIVFSDDGSRLATASTDGTLRLWDVASGSAIGKPFKQPELQAIVFSADGKRLAAGSKDGLVSILEVPGMNPLGRPMKHFGVTDILFSRDGKRLLTADVDSPLLLWDISSGRAIAALPAQTTLGSAKALLESTGGAAKILYAVQDHVLRVWWRNPVGDQLLAVACARIQANERETQSLEKYGIIVSSAICQPGPPAPEWSRIDQAASSPR